ncbi:MAG TPA: methyltransferase domain-containing protein [Isosphaeraceae bacterium]|nr:methyltransferase domain-containing protein [Isosphaeraceae bacterium]
MPKARRIVDLGGSCEGRPEGAMVAFGYPYAFESLSIVELPRDERHALYAEICGEYRDVIATPQGPVCDVYSSLADLSAFEDGSIDLVYSGQSIEHVTLDDAVAACREVCHVLRPGGHFCLDTPNRAVTKIQYPDEYINPDHKYEFTHAELSALLSSTGFAIEEAKGACLFARSLASGVFDLEEAVRHAHLYDDIEQCYLLYYRCRKPS